MDRYRFFVERLGDGGPGEAVEGGVELPEGEAHHALAVLRLETGAGVEVFDGKGGWVRGTLEAVGKRRARVVVEESGKEVRGRPFLTLATAAPKGDRAEWLIEQASQLGVGAVQWVDCAGAVVRPREGGGKMEKWRRLAVESAKQCGRNWLMEVREMKGLEVVVKEAVGRGEAVWWLEPRSGVGIAEAVAGGGEQEAAGEKQEARSKKQEGGSGKLEAGSRKVTRGICALIGPEGGWSEREVAMLEGLAGPGGGVVRVKLMGTVLRIETACACVAAVVGTTGEARNMKRET